MTRFIRHMLSKSCWHCALLIALLMPASALAETWQLQAGAESPKRGTQGLAFLPNEIWIHAGDTIRWTFPTHERHTLTFLKPGQTRPPAFGPTFGVLVGCPGVTPDEMSFDGSTCLTSDVLLLDVGAKHFAHAAATQQGDPQLTYLKTGRRFEPLRHDPRFLDLVRRVGLSQ